MPNLVGPVSFGPLKPISVVPKEKVNCMVLENCLDPRPKKRREGEREKENLKMCCNSVCSSEKNLVKEMYFSIFLCENLSAYV